MVTLMYCCGGWDRHWFTKNCINISLGTLVISWTAWSIVSGHPQMNLSYTISAVTLSLYVGRTANLQDLRAVEGDKRSGRLTMPICLGMAASKKLLSIVFAIEPVILYFTVWNQPVQSLACAQVAMTITMFKLVYILADILAHLYISLRLFYLDHSYSDLHYTYLSSQKHFRSLS